MVEVDARLAAGGLWRVRRVRRGALGGDTSRASMRWRGRCEVEVVEGEVDARLVVCGEGGRWRVTKWGPGYAAIACAAGGGVSPCA